MEAVTSDSLMLAVTITQIECTINSANCKKMPQTFDVCSNCLTFVVSKNKNKNVFEIFLEYLKCV